MAQPAGTGEFTTPPLLALTKKRTGTGTFGGLSFSRCPSALKETVLVFWA